MLDSSESVAEEVAVSTTDFAHDVSRLDRAELGSGSLQTLVTGGRGGTQNALLAATASEKADILVTEDGALRKKLRAENISGEA
jgi:hypothetical protein